MSIIYDPEKCKRNIRERAISFDVVGDFEWDSAYVLEDIRKDYGERRYQALGVIRGRVHMVVFTPRGPDIQVISVRKANQREIERYEEERAIEDE